jgi:hypothetical protein
VEEEDEDEEEDKDEDDGKRTSDDWPGRDGKYIG